MAQLQQQDQSNSVQKESGTMTLAHILELFKICFPWGWERQSRKESYSYLKHYFSNLLVGYSFQQPD